MAKTRESKGRNPHRRPWLAAGAALLAGLFAGLTAAPASAKACGGDSGLPTVENKMVKGGKRYALQIGFEEHGYYFKGGSYVFHKLRVFTRDRRFARFLYDENFSQEAWKRMRKVADRRHCGHVYDGRALVRLERDLARTLVQLYRAKTKRWTKTPDLMLGLWLDENQGHRCKPPVPHRRSKP